MNLRSHTALRLLAEGAEGPAWLADLLSQGKQKAQCKSTVLTACETIRVGCATWEVPVNSQTKQSVTYRGKGQIIFFKYSHFPVFTVLPLVVSVTHSQPMSKNIKLEIAEINNS